MQSLKKNITQLPLAMLQFCQQQQHPWLLSVISCTNILHQNRSIDTLYSSESCEDCVGSYKMPAARENLERMKEPDRTKNKDPCWQSLRRTEYKCRTDPEFLLDAFIDARKKCLEDPCAWDVPRADLTHYRPSDKLKRKYQRTWLKCVMKRRKIKMQYVCKPINIKRRKFKRIQRNSPCDVNPCTLGAPDLDLQKCKPKPKKTKCPRLAMPCRKKGVVPPSCKRGGRKPSKCRKRLTKYPAFSECLIDPLPDAPPVECNCLKTPMMCQVWEYYRNRKS